MTASSGYEKISIESPLLREKRICVIDFETTGIGAGAEVIEFACVRLSGEGLGLRLASLCCPYGYVSPDITRLTGISDHMTRSHPHFDDFLPLCWILWGTISSRRTTRPSTFPFYCATADRRALTIIRR